MRVPPESDGTTVSQTPVAPGDGFTYEFVAEDAGTFWYHPHVRQFRRRVLVGGTGGRNRGLPDTEHGAVRHRAVS
ncbi:MAG TPA: multicopper oxidase domain-containing protein [Polyangiaceae bacterium]